MNLDNRDKLLQLEKAIEELHVEVELEKERSISKAIIFLRTSMIIAAILGVLAYLFLKAKSSQLIIICILELVLVGLTTLRLKYVISKLEIFKILLTDDLNKKIDELEHIE